MTLIRYTALFNITQKLHCIR